MKFARFAFSLLMLTVLTTATARTAVAQDPPKDDERKVVAITSLPALSREIHDAMQSRAYGDAIKLIEAALGNENAPAPDYMRYLQGIAQTELKQYEAAVGTFTKLESDFPKSSWVSRSRFGRADVYVRQRLYIKAGEIYQKEAERLLSRGRKDELCKIYLEFANRYFEGVPADDPSKAKKPDYEQALSYYNEAIKLGPTVGLKQKVDFRIARCYEERNELASAASGYQEFLTQYGGDQPKSGTPAPVPMLAEATYRLGATQLKANKRANARRTWQDLLADWQGKDKADDADAINAFLAKAEYRLAHTYGLPTPASVGELEQAVAAAEKFLKGNPDHELASKAELEVAQGFAHHRRHDPAIKRLQSLIANPSYTDSAEVPTARQMLGQQFLARGDFDDAITAWRSFLDKHPTDPKWPLVQQQIVNTEYAKADAARKERKYDVARESWQTFLNKYPLDHRAPKILFQFGEMNHAKATVAHNDRIKEATDRGESAQSVQLNDQCKEIFEEAIVDWRRVVSKYPSSHEASNASFMIGQTLEDKLSRLKDALDSYKQVKGGFASMASKRIKRLTTPQLLVATERKFRSDEKPRIKLTTRNLKNVTVKAYRVDMVDYFRKMHLASGVETLDIALIDPDEQFQHAVGDYAEYRQTDEDIELPIDGPGVTAVTVSSDKLEATTMVVVSDLDMIVKASRNELFLFAQNMRTGKPVEGASVLISDGSELFGESVTGADGILQRSFDELKEVTDLRAFSVIDGHMASTVNNLNGLDFAVGLAPRGYLYTERPAYRRGQLVNIKGIVRWVDQDRFTFKPGEKFTVDVYDSRGRQLHSKQVALNDFGTVSSNVILPDSAPQGDYRVHMHRPASAGTNSAAALSFETRFKVTEYKLEPVQVDIDLDKRVYFRGEKVTGTITLKYYYGTPLKNESIEYRFGPDGETMKTKTDKNGQVKVKLETQRFSESQPLQLNVMYPQRGISAAKTVFLATKGFAITATTMRPVYVNGESFESMFTVADPSGEPLETKLKVEVFKRTSVRGQSGEKLVQTHETTTDAADGTARKTLTLSEAGVYFVRATGKDQFDNDVSGQLTVRISGDKDETRLRVLADQFSYQVGDIASINLHWREAPALALITHEGASVLGHQLVNLKKGDNVLKLPMESAFAPNFYFSVAVMQRNRFHTAKSEFRVSQRLRIKLTPTQTELRPGEDLSVQIEATDPQGKPVEAEVSLALIQTNLLNMFSDVQGSVDTFFGAGNRKTSVRQSTSCTFSYKPKTRAVSQFLLAESDRRATLDNEVRALAALNTNVNGAANFSGDFAMSNGNAIGGELDDLFGGGTPAQPAPENQSTVIPSFIGGMVQSGREVPVTIMTTQTKTRMVPVQRTRIETRTRTVPVTTMKTVIRDGRQVQVPVVTQRTEQYQVSVPYTENVEQSYTVQVPLQSTRTQNYQVGVPYTEQISQNYTVQVPQVGRRLNERNESDFKQQGFSNSAGMTSWAINNRFNQRMLSLNGITKNGQFLTVNRDDKRANQLLRDNALQLLPAMAHAETAFWDPAIVTDAKGQAFITLTLPQRSTAWRLRAKGIDTHTLAGEATADVITKKDLFGELRLPLAFTAGDEASIPVEVHSALEGARGITVKLRTTMGDRSTEQTKTIDTQGPGVHKVEFPVEITEADVASFQLTVSNGADLSDTSKQNVSIRPFGFPVFQTASGTSSQSTLAMIDFDEKLQADGAALEIVIGADVDRALIESVTDAVAMNASFGMIPQELVLRCGLPISNPLERAASDLLGGIALLEMIANARASDTPEAQAITGRITSAVSQLVSSQQASGGWAWSGESDATPDQMLTARIMWALSSARNAGFAVPQKEYSKGKSVLQKWFAATSQSDLERQTVLLHAMALSGCGDFAFANRLHRERNRLSASGLTHLALTLTAMKHKEMADELIAMIKLPTDNTPLDAEQRAMVLPWMRNRTELQAMYLLALQEIAPDHADIPKLAKSILSARVGPRWPVEKSNGPAIAALARWNARNRHVSAKYKLTIFVNDNELKTLTIDPDTDSSRRLQVPGKWLNGDRAQRIEFQLEGRATFSYSAVLTGFVAADKIANTTKRWSVSRTYQPAQRMFDGRVVPRGFGVVNGSYRSFTNPLTQLPVGARAEVKLSPRRHQITGRSDERHDYLVLTEPIPAGCTVLNGSVNGQFDRYEIEPGQVTFHVGNRRHPGDIRYTLVGYVPGEFRAAQPILRSFYEPSRFAVHKVTELDVIAPGSNSKDEYRLSPDELYHLGERHFANRDFDKAHDYLTQLYSEWTLDADKNKKVVQWLFSASLSKQTHGDTVKYFEVLKEKFPDVEISFEDILSVANSYRELGEYERSYLVYRATVEASFERESQVAGFLNARGEFTRSVQAMERLLRDYPPESYLATATYALAQETYRRAPLAKDDKKLTEAGVTRIHLIDGAVKMLDHFVTNWPEDPASDQASFALATALLDLEKFEVAIERSERYAKRYPKSQLLDSFWYMIGYSHFELEHPQEALTMCRKVAEATFQSPKTGTMRPAENRWEAIYIMGQIHHSLGNAADAIAEYAKVKERFADASEAISFFTRKEIAMEEVTTIRPKDDKQVTLTFRNVKEAAIKVYRIDLMKFGLMQRNLDRITAINLAGIKPYHEETVALGDGNDFRDREKQLALPLNEEGAYLIVCRGGNLYSSALALVSPLKLLVQEDAASGRVRVSVKDSSKDSFIGDVHVKVIGSSNKDFKSGNTDLRGLFIADDVRGSSTVIAASGNDRYAFYRGKQSLQAVPTTPNAAPADPFGAPAADASQQAEASKAPSPSGKGALRGNLMQKNGMFQVEQQMNYENLMNNGRKGVKSKEAY